MRRYADVTERWVIVPGFPDYEVSDLGRIKRITKSRTGPGRPGTFLHPSVPPSATYPMLSICRDGKRYSRTVHSIVCEAFHGPRPSPDHEVAHWDGVHTNAAAANLRWATRKENGEDSARHGTNRGANNGRSKLSEDDVRTIRRRRSQGETQQRIAEDYGITQVQVSTICSFKQWGWVT